MRSVLLSALALAAFSAVYSAAAWYDWWPRLPPGALHDTDLWAGIGGGLGLLTALLFDRVGKKKSKDEASRLRAVGEGLAPPAPTS